MMAHDRDTLVLPWVFPGAARLEKSHRNSLVVTGTGATLCSDDQTSFFTGLGGKG